MKNPGFALLLLLLPCIGLAEPSSWKEFHSPEGRFSVLMPGTPKEQTSSVMTGSGPIELHYISVEQGETFYSVSYAEFPTDPTLSRDLDSVLNGARDRMVTNITGTLLSESQVDVQGHAARELVIDAYSGAAVLTCRMFLAGRRLYQLSTGMPKKGAVMVDPIGFFNSFRLDSSISESHLRTLLKSLGYQAVKNGSGQFQLTTQFNDGRSQTAYLGTDSSAFYNGEVYSLWSFVYKAPGALPDSVSRRLFEATAMKDLGAYYMVHDDSSTVVIFAARIGTAADATQLRRGLILVSSVADEMEKELSKEDKY